MLVKFYKIGEVQLPRFNLETFTRHSNIKRIHWSWLINNLDNCETQAVWRNTYKERRLKIEIAVFSQA